MLTIIYALRCFYFFQILFESKIVYEYSKSLLAVEFFYNFL